MARAPLAKGGYQLQLVAKKFRLTERAPHWFGGGDDGLNEEEGRVVCFFHSYVLMITPIDSEHTGQTSFDPMAFFMAEVYGLSYKSI